MRQHRELTDRLLLIVSVIFLARVYVAEPFVIQTSSMAPRFLGQHVEAICPRCHRPGSWAQGLGDNTLCQNCGQTVPHDSLVSKPGDRVWVLKSTASSLCRWDVVALKCPDRPREVYVKRLVGMPGETLRLARGDVEILNPTTGGFEVLVKPDHAVRDCAITLAQSRFVDADGGSRIGHDSKEWQREGDTYQLLKEIGTLQLRPKFVALTYNGVRSESSKNDDLWADPILTFNFEPSAATHTLAIELTGLRLHWDLESGRCRFEEMTTFDVPCPSLGKPRVLAKSRTDRPSKKVPCELFWVDGRAQWSVGGEPVLSVMHPFPSPLLENSVSMEVAGKGAKISGLVLGRDIHYQSTSLGKIGPEYRLGEGEYLVLGDNSDVSEDSRWWKRGPAVPARLILGKVMGRIDLPVFDR